jgi:hypothetical protein
MIDTERYFDSLNRAREFTVTEDHLELLRHLCDGGLSCSGAVAGRAYGLTIRATRASAWP